MDIKSLIEQAQNVQTQMQQMQQEMINKEFTGESAGGLVKIVFNGGGVAKEASIDPSLLKEEEKETLQDLVVAAVNNARKNSESALSEKMKAITGGMNFPPNLGGGLGGDGSAGNN